MPSPAPPNDNSSLHFEVGPIRPPSEAHSLLLRVTRNCPWNRCAFCPVYKDQKFSIRELEQVKRDVQAMGRVAELLRETSVKMGLSGVINRDVFLAAAHRFSDPAGPQQIAIFLISGGDRAFLQDGNSLVMPPDPLVEVLGELRRTFPSLCRITTYCRSHTLTRRTPAQLAQIRQAGLTRVHVGLESGSDQVLTLVRKGVDGARQIEAGLRAKAAGFELSEYLMPGLGGRALSSDHARESARVLSAIDPHFIRLRTTAFAPGTALAELVSSGELEPMDDEEIVEEIRLFLENLEGSATIRSDHTLNLLQELEGKFPADKQRLLGVIHRFQALDHPQRWSFILGRRVGLLNTLDDLDQPELRERAMALLDQVRERSGGDLPRAVREIMRRFV